MAAPSVAAFEAARTAVEAFRTRALRSVPRKELINYAYKRVSPTAGAPLPMPSPVSLSKSKGMLLARAALVPGPQTKKTGSVADPGTASAAEDGTTDAGPAPRKAKFVSPTSLAIPNPFLPHKAPGSKFWTGPRISLRMQKKLVQAAKASGTLHLLPPGPKTPLLFSKDVRAEKRILQEDGIQVTPGKIASEPWASLPVTWTSDSHETPVLKDPRLEVRAKESMVRAYSGRRVKFRKHVWERNLPKRGAHRKILMRDMARRVRRYKNHYKRKLPDPLKPVSSTKSRKLPF